MSCVALHLKLRYCSLYIQYNQKHHLTSASGSRRQFEPSGVEGHLGRALWCQICVATIWCISHLVFPAASSVTDTNSLGYFARGNLIYNSNFWMIIMALPRWAWAGSPITPEYIVLRRVLRQWKCMSILTKHLNKHASYFTWLADQSLWLPTVSDVQCEICELKMLGKWNANSANEKWNVQRTEVGPCIPTLDLGLNIISLITIIS